MCGITGFADFKENISERYNTLRTMTSKLLKRGPDDTGFWTEENVMLGHRRLIVVDPDGGKQPMFKKQGEREYILVYNGELYNTEDIRTKLLNKGYHFDGWSDTEVVLTSYIEWGEDCVEYFNGIFAFCVWDKEEKKLFFARDRIGVKPLFYSVEGSTLIFGSEIKSILAHEKVSAEIDREGLSELFVIGPARTPGLTPFHNIKELRAGHTMTYTENGLKINKYYRLDSHSHEDDLDTTKEKVKHLVTDAITRQLVSDVPLCVMLSGGLDSSIISAVSSNVYKTQLGTKIRSFSVDYVDNDKNFRANEFQPDADAPWVDRVSDFLGTEHEICKIDTPELYSALFDAVIARDTPGMTDVDSSLLLFSRWIRERATVGLSGECADEIFGGYPWFYRKNAETENTFPWTRNFDKKMSLLTDSLVSEISPKAYLDRRYEEALSEVPFLSGESEEQGKKRELFYLNLTRWMPTLLDRKDRMSMACGLELRVPFCDHRIVDYAWNIPWEMKFYNEREKGLLRSAMKGVLPEDVLWRKKSPYPKTHNPDYTETLKKAVLKLISDGTSPVFEFIDKTHLYEYTLSVTPLTSLPWFGQLMNAPQLLAYILQTDFWMKKYNISVM